MLQSARARLRALELIALGIVLMMPIVGSEYTVTLTSRIVALALLAISFDLIWGYAGILSFGQAFFFGIGGYTTAILATTYQVTELWVLLPAALLLGALASFIIGIVVLTAQRQLSLIFVAFGTLAASFAAETVATGWPAIGAANGIPGIPYWTFAGGEIEGRTFLAVISAIGIGLYLAARYLLSSRYGLIIVSLRQNETRLRFLGYETGAIKIGVFTIAGGIAGVAGCIFAVQSGYVAPSMLGVTLSTTIVFYVFFGGCGYLIGGVYGVAIVEVVGAILAQQYPEAWPIVIGAILVAVVLYRPTGLVGVILGQRGIHYQYGGRKKTVK